MSYEVYPTPPETIENFLPYLVDLLSPKTAPFIIEPGAGNAPFLRALEPYYPSAYYCAVDIRNVPFPPWIDGFGLTDFLEWEPTSLFDLLVTNPPFSLSIPFFEKCLEIAADGADIVFLQRLGFMASQKRKDFWKANKPKHVRVLSYRPGFIKTGSANNDRYDYAWYHWQKGYTGPSTLDWIERDED